MSVGVTISSTSSYAILGCGSVGHAVAEELVGQGKDVLIIDKDEGRVEALRDQDLNAQTARIEDEDVIDAVSDRDVILIMSSDIESNKAAIQHLRGANLETFIVARANDPVSGDELDDLGADVVINPSTVIANAALRALESGELEYKANQLGGVLKSAEKKLAILSFESPEPDSIASSVALQAIAEHVDLDADIIYFGDLGLQENRAFVNLLDIDLYSIDEVDLEEYDTFAGIAPRTEPTLDVDLDIVIGHVEPTEELEAEFMDVRSTLSSTSTILTKYIQQFDVGLSEDVATALLYGIREKTMDFKRNTTPADLTAAAYLYPFADHDALEQVESPSMSPETLDVLAEAITNRAVQGSHLVSDAGFIRNPEALEQAAQHLLDLEGITTTTVFGIEDENIYLAARSKDIRMNIGKVLKDAFGDIGEVSGHSTQASVEITLGIFTGIETTEDNRDTLLQLTEEAVKRKLFDAMGLESSGESTNNS